MSKPKQGRKHITAEERIRNFRLIDDLFFGLVFDNDVQLTGKILSLILGRKVEIVSAVAERTEIVLSGRGIRSDLKAIDTKGNKYGLEAQKGKRGMHPKRLSYNLAMMSDGIMEKGCNDWNQMKHRYVIMFCEFDYFGNGKAITYGETIFDGRPADVGTTMIYVNCAYRGDDAIGRLTHDMMCSNPENIYDKDIREKVRKIKEGKEIIRMCEVLETAVRKAVARERQRINTEKNRVIKEKDHVIDAMTKENKYALVEKDHVIADMGSLLRTREQEIEMLKRENELLQKRTAPVSMRDS